MQIFLCIFGGKYFFQIKRNEDDKNMLLVAAGVFSINFQSVFTNLGGKPSCFLTENKIYIIDSDEIVFCFSFYSLKFSKV